MRKLASVQKIKSIEPIEGADKIELAHVLGWQCVVNKGKFAPGDLAIYFEIDSFLPEREEFEFLRASSFRENEIVGRGFRLRTQKFRGALSQGLLLPLDEVYVYTSDGHKKEKLSSIRADNGTPLLEGDDVTDLLGVKKWEITEMATTGGTVVGNLPASVPYTDEIRVQNAEELIAEFAGLEFYISTKMDGSSHSISFDSDGFHVTGHNYEYKDDGSSSFYEYVKKHDLPEKMREFVARTGLVSLSIQGEYCGPGIQQNRIKLKAPEWYVFTVNENGKRVGLREMLSVCELLGLNSVPIEEISEDLPEEYPTVEDILERADGNYITGGRKEGIVIRPVEPVYSKTLGGPLSIKAVSNKYLLRNGD